MSGPHAVRGANLSRRSRVVAAVVGAGAVVAVGLAGVAVTAASYQDRAYVNVGAEGVGSVDPFDLVLVGPDGIAHDAPVGAGLALEVPGAEALVPGRSVEVVVQVANNHPAIAAGLAVSVSGEPVGETPDIREFLRFSVLDAEGGSLVGGSWEDPGAGLVLGETGDVGVLAARGEAPVEHGGEWTAGAEGSSRAVTVLVHMVDAPETEAFNGGQARLAVQLHGTSVDS